MEQTVQPLLQTALDVVDLQAALTIAGRDRDQLILTYPPVKTGTGYAPPTILLAFGARATGEPHQVLPVSCDMAPWVDGVGFPQASPLVMAAERTFWERPRPLMFIVSKAVCGVSGIPAIGTT